MIFWGTITIEWNGYWIMATIILRSMVLGSGNHWFQWFVMEWLLNHRQSLQTLEAELKSLFNYSHNSWLIKRLTLLQLCFSHFHFTIRILGLFRLWWAFYYLQTQYHGIIVASPWHQQDKRHKRHIVTSACMYIGWEVLHYMSPLCRLQISCYRTNTLDIKPHHWKYNMRNRQYITHTVVKHSKHRVSILLIFIDDSNQSCLSLLSFNQLQVLKHPKMFDQLLWFVPQGL